MGGNDGTVGLVDLDEYGKSHGKNPRVEPTPLKPDSPSNPTGHEKSGEHVSSEVIKPSGSLPGSQQPVEPAVRPDSSVKPGSGSTKTERVNTPTLAT